MTTTTWTTTDDVPLGPWSAASADIRTLLAVMADAGSTITNPAGNTGPVFTDAQIAFAVTLPGRGPLAVTFQRAAGAGEVDTSSALTDGLVLVALARAARHWGQLLTVTSDAGTAARTIRDTVVEQLFGASDRAVNGGGVLSVPAQLASALAAAQDRIAAGDPAGKLTFPKFLAAVVGDLEAQLSGLQTAAALFHPATPTPTPTPTPAPDPTPEPEPEPEPTTDPQADPEPEPAAP